ncbi:MAG: hypothetical protein ACREBQ_10145, partial [Nitrososphaerales archaeon]
NFGQARHCDLARNGAISNYVTCKSGLRSSFRHMAKKTHVSNGTVRNRIRLMRASGVLTGTSVYPNPSLRGLKGGAYAFDVAASAPKVEIIEELKLIDGLWFIHNFHGSLVGILFVYPNEKDLQNKIQQFHNLSGAKDGIFSRVFYPACVDTLTDLDGCLSLDWSSENFNHMLNLQKSSEPV